MKLLRTNTSNTQDLTQMVTRYTWSGDKSSCCRTLEFDLVCIAGDTALPTVEIDLGDHVGFYDDRQLFDGFVFSIQKATNDRTKTIRCFDRGIYLNRNQGYYRFQNTTPEAVAKRLAADFGFSLGSIAATGHLFSRNFLGQTLYKILATGYTLASASTGEKYQIGFELDKLTVWKKRQDDNTLVIRGGSNLLRASVTESIENLINRVRIVDQAYNLVTTKENTDSIRKYGVFQNVLRQTDNISDQAGELLEDNGPTQKISLSCVGDTRSITGRAVAVQETHTGLWGLFWIESDIHTWTNGIYTNKLVVSFRNVMDEQEVGTLEAAASAGSTSVAASTSGAAKTASWVYYRE